MEVFDSVQRSCLHRGRALCLLGRVVAAIARCRSNDLARPNGGRSQDAVLGESTRQIGVDETNDFIFGELHNALRQRLFDNLGAVAAAIPLNELPPSPLLKGGEQLADLLRILGLDSAGILSMDDLRNLLKLEAPLAVQARPPHAGFFPLNKFSTVPLLMKSARTAVSDSNGDDEKKSS